MKQKKRLLKLFKETKKGNHDAMMEAIELLVDSKDDIPFDNGYRACMDDMGVRGYRLAEYIIDQSIERGKIGKDCNDEPLTYLNDVDELAQIIEEYFNEALNG